MDRATQPGNNPPDPTGAEVAALRRELEARERELEILHDAAATLGRTLELEAIHDTLFRLVSRVMDTDGFCVSSFDPGEGLIRAVYVRVEGERVDAAALPPLPLEPEGQGIQSLVIRTGEPVIIPDYPARRRPTTTQYYVSACGDVATEETDEQSTRSAIVLPIALEGRVLGVLQVMSYRYDAYSPAHLKLMQALLFQVAAATHNTHLLEQARREAEHREAVEAQLIQSQKMEAIGRLAGGVAHDFNNLLSVINGYSETLLYRHGNDPQLGAPLRAILDAGNRAAALTRQLLAFSRQQIIEPKVLDLNQIVAGTERMLRRLIGEDVELIARLAPDAGRVYADAGQIDQVLINLAVNARDAMPTGGSLTIETRNADLDETYARDHPAIQPGRYVVLSVSDSGCGMDAATQARVFEPFFTTKEQGKGTGLGLATVHGIVSQSGGHIQLHSEPGHGTTFEIYLPRLDDEASTVEEAADPLPLSGTETILVVEDSAPVRALAAEVLRVSGYSVMEAESGDEAIRLCEEGSCRPDLVLTDVVMPGMSGPVLQERLAVLCPHVPVLFMSGYTDDAVLRHGIQAHGVSFIHKPFTIVELTRKVRELLDGRLRGPRPDIGAHELDPG